jgi:hypothetical protein
MPYDCYQTTDAPTVDLRPDTTPVKIDYKARREAAVKLWSRVPSEVFDINFWKNENGCCCALGWLATEEHNGWHYYYSQRNNMYYPAFQKLTDYKAAANYFGISIAEARACFGNNKKNIFKKWWFQKIKPIDVSKALMKFQYPE